MVKFGKNIAPEEKSEEKHRRDDMGGKIGNGFGGGQQ